jgi:DeoR/GlpR family transcriptional regulator of sugar metabolism
LLKALWLDRGISRFVIFFFFLHDGDLNGYERKIEIVRLLEEKGDVNINHLSESFGVTKVTIRSDIDSLETRGLLVRTHGGAALPEDHHLVRRITHTIRERKKEKEGIARVARTLIEPGSTVLIDSGSTTAILARHLKDMSCTNLIEAQLSFKGEVVLPERFKEYEIRDV